MTERLSDLTRQLETNKALRLAGDRLLGIALESAQPFMRKAAVPAIGTSDAPWIGDADAQPIVDAVQRRSVPGRLLALGAQAVPARRLLPVDSGDDPEPTWTTEGAAVPLARITSGYLTADPTNYTLMLAYTKDLLRLADARARTLITARSIRAVVRGDDRAMISDTAASAAQPAGILAGLSAVGSGSPTELALDFERLVADVRDGDALAPVFVTSARGAAYLAASSLQAFKDLGITGGTISRAPAIVSPAAGARLILLDASSIAIADDGIDVSRSEQAAIEMVDNPSASSVSGTGAQLVSAFQANAVVLRYVRWLSWQRLVSDAVAFIDLPIDGSPA